MAVIRERMAGAHAQPPKYGILMEELRARVRDGRYRVGDLIPSEPQLQAEFGVSRVTVRRAIDELAREGLLRKEQGRGTYVHSPEITQDLNTLVGVTETMYAMGLVPEDLSTQLFLEAAPDPIAQMLGLQTGDAIWHLVRRRGSDGVPINLTDNFIVPRLVPGLSRDLLLQSLYATYERVFGLTLVRGEEIVEAKAAGEIDAALLQVRRGAPILVVTRTTFLDSGDAIEVAIVRSRSDRYRYAIRLAGRPLVEVPSPVVPRGPQQEKPTTTEPPRATPGSSNGARPRTPRR